MRWVHMTIRGEVDRTCYIHRYAWVKLGGLARRQDPRLYAKGHGRLNQFTFMLQCALFFTEHKQTTLYEAELVSEPICKLLVTGAAGEMERGENRASSSNV